MFVYFRKAFYTIGENMSFFGEIHWLLRLMMSALNAKFNLEVRNSR